MRTLIALATIWITVWQQGDVYNTWEGCCENGHPGWAIYNSSQTITKHDGVIDIWAHKRKQPDGTWRAMATAISPTLPGGDIFHYGRIRITIGVFPDGSDSMRGWSMSNLLIAKDGDWNKGEVNWPEAQLDVANQTAVAFNHKLGDPRINCDQFYRKNVWTVYGWHTYIMDVKPDSIAFYYDWQLLGVSTCALPTAPLNYVFQVGTLGKDPSADAHGHILLKDIVVDRMG